MEYASRWANGVSVAGLVTGVAGLLGEGMNILGGGTGCQQKYVTKEEMQLLQQIAQKDSDIADLKAESAAETKMIEVYKQTRSEIKELSDIVAANKDQQAAINTQQAVINAQVGANIAVAQNQIADINATLCNLTKTIIPITNVCPEPMKAFNSWTAPT